MHVVRLDLHEFLHSRLHQNPLTLFAAQYIAVLHLLASSQNNGDGAPIGQHGSQPGALSVFQW
jgi:hypothetical protein